MAGTNKQLQRVNNFITAIRESGGDEKKLKAAIAAVDPTKPEQYGPLLAEFTKALNAVRTQLAALDANPRLEPHYLAHGLAFLNALAEISPNAKAVLRQRGLYLISVDELRANRAKVADLKAILNAALEEARIADMYQNILRAMVAAKQAATEQEQEYYGLLLNGLKKTLTHQGVAKDEMNDLGEMSIKTANRNLLYDPYRKLGALLAAIYFLTKGAALEAEQHPDMTVAPHEPLEGADQPYRNQRLSQFGIPV